MVFSVRTLFLMIRGVDQSGGALREVRRNVLNVAEAQEAMQRASYRMLFAGAAFLAFGTMAIKALGGTLAYTERGSRILEDFGTVFDRIKAKIGAVIVDKFGETISKWLTQLDNLTGHPLFDEMTELTITLASVAVQGGLLLTGLSIFQGVMNVLIPLLVTAGLMTPEFAMTTLAGITSVGTGLILAFVGAQVVIAISKIVWELLPQAQKDAWQNFWEAIKPQRTKGGTFPTKILVGDEWIDWTDFLGGTGQGLTGMETGLAGLTGQAQTGVTGGVSVSQDFQVFIENIGGYEELDEFINDYQKSSSNSIIQWLGNLFGTTP